MLHEMIDKRKMNQPDH